jgi:hypothetical protein
MTFQKILAVRITADVVHHRRILAGEGHQDVLAIPKAGPALDA